MDSRFENIINKNLTILKEAEMPPPPPAGGEASALPGAPGGAPPMDGGLGDMMGGGAEAPEPEMDDDAKKEADPNQFTKSVLEKLVKVSPEMFDRYVDTFSTNFLKIKDKEEFKRYYATFYAEMKRLFEIQDDLKDLFRQLRGDVEEIVTNDDASPDVAKGGDGRAGPAGPGV